MMKTRDKGVVEDTIVVAAHEDRFWHGFMKDGKWGHIAIDQGRIDRGEIHYIAVYRARKEQKITHYAPVRRFRPSPEVPGRRIIY